MSRSSKELSEDEIRWRASNWHGSQFDRGVSMYWAEEKGAAASGQAEISAAN